MKKTVTYVANEEKRIVTARGTRCEFDALKEIAKVHMPGMKVNQIPNYERYMIKDTFTSTAKCHPDDVFNERKGQMVAEGKMMHNYSRAKAKAIRRYANDMAKMAKMADKVATRYAIKAHVADDI